MSQTTYEDAPPIAVEGMRADMGLEHRVESYLAEGDLLFGTLVQAGTDPDKQVKPLTDIPAADVDSIVSTPVAMSGAAETFVSGADLDGVIGAKAINPAQRVTIALNPHADWLATTGEIFYEDVEGEPQVEEFDIPAGGNVTRQTLRPCRRVDLIHVPQQAGANATLTAGTAGTAGGYSLLSPRDCPGVVFYDPATEPASSTTDVADEQDVNVLVQGTIYVKVEAAVIKGDGAWVRTTEALPDKRGQFRGSYAVGFTRLAGASFKTSAAADGLAVLELGN
jgi:hypothetical protein